MLPLDILSVRKRNKFDQKVKLLKPDQIQFGWVFKFHIIIAIIIALCVPQDTKASISISAGNKSWFILEAKAGSQVHAKATLINGENRPININIYSVDAEEDKKTGAFLTGNYDPDGLFEKWMMERKSMTMKPLSKEELAFSISIPNDTPSGEYIGALMAEEKNEGDEAISINTRAGARIYLTVKNDNPKQLLIPEISNGGQESVTIDSAASETALVQTTPSITPTATEPNTPPPELGKPAEINKIQEDNKLEKEPYKAVREEKNTPRDLQIFPAFFLIGAATVLAGMAIRKKMKK